MTSDWQPLFLTFQLALITTLILLFIGTPIAYWIAFSKFKFKSVIETLVTMPLVLPPSVLGFYLLTTLSPQTFLGEFLEHTFNLKLVFTFEGLVLGSVIFSLPFMVLPILSGFQNLPASLREASYSLGKSKLATLFRVLAPNIKPSLLAAIVLTFAHTVGEFGVVLMLGGSIPGETRVASIAIYEEVEALNYATAHLFSIILFATTFFTLLTVYIFNKKSLTPI